MAWHIAVAEVKEDIVEHPMKFYLVVSERTRVTFKGKHYAWHTNKRSLAYRPVYFADRKAALFAANSVPVDIDFLGPNFKFYRYTTEEHNG